MFTTIRRWIRSHRDLTMRKQIVDRRSDGVRQLGFVLIGREWFQFRSKVLETHDGRRLVTSFYRVVDGAEALQAHEAGEVDVPDFWKQSEQAEIRALASPPRAVLPFRSYAHEGYASDYDRSLREAVAGFQQALRSRTAEELRTERRDPGSPLHMMEAERAEAMLRYPGWNGVEPLHDFWARTDPEPSGSDEDAAQDEVPSPSPRLAEAKELLDSCFRYELRDSAFSDREVMWYAPRRGDHNPEEPVVADGYFGRSADLAVYFDGEDVRFEGDEAMSLMHAGTLAEWKENSSIDAVEH